MDRIDGTNRKYVDFRYTTAAEIRDLLIKFYSQILEEKLLQVQKVNWFDLTDSQKHNVLEHARTYLHQQVREARISKSVVEVLDKHGLV